MTSSEIWRVVLTVLNSFLRQSCSVSTNVTSALEVFLNVVLYKSTFYLLTYLQHKKMNTLCDIIWNEKRWPSGQFPILHFHHKHITNHYNTVCKCSQHKIHDDETTSKPPAIVRQHLFAGTSWPWKWTSSYLRTSFKFQVITGKSSSFAVKSVKSRMLKAVSYEWRNVNA